MRSQKTLLRSVAKRKNVFDLHLVMVRFRGCDIEIVMQTGITTLAALARPSRARYIVIGLLCSMALVLYLDRVCIAQALVPMKREYGWTNTQASLVLMAFTLAYGLFEIPTGRLGDLYGSRGVLTRIVLWWSVFTALTGALPEFTYVASLASVPLVFNSLALMVLVRFWFGAGEAGAIPNAARILVNWFPAAERGRMQGLFQGSMHVGGAVAPVLAAEIIEHAGWRWTFGIFGLVGLVWAVVFFWWFRDKPDQHDAVNLAELQIIGAPVAEVHGHGAVPWGEALVNANVWLLSITIIMSAFNSYFFFSWYSTYLQEGRGVDNETAGWLAALALLGATVGSLSGGVLADRITRHAANRYRARRLLCLGAFFGAALFLLASVNVDSAILSAAFCGLACWAMFCHLPTWWGCAFDVSGKHTGAMFGLLNGVGVVGAIGAQYFWGWFADWRKSLGYAGRDQWDPAFYVSIAFLIAAGILWQFVYPRRTIGESEPSG
jgi:MFS family permease